MSRLCFALALGIGLSTGVALAQSQGPAVPTQSFGAEDAGAPASNTTTDAATPNASATPAQPAAPRAAEPVPANPYQPVPANPYGEPVPANPYVVPPRPARAAGSMDGTPEAPAKTHEEQDWHLHYGWNLGAGFGLGNYGFLVGSSESGATTVPTYQMSIERRVGPKTWLVLSALFQNSVTDVELESNSDPNVRRTVERASNAIGGLIGVRHAIVSGIVEVSLFGTVGATYGWIGGPKPGEDESYGSYSTLPGTKSKAFEAMGGLTVERELIEALALRLSTGVAALRVGTESGVVDAGEGVRRRNTSFASFRLQLAPVLELRFYF